MEIQQSFASALQLYKAMSGRTSSECAADLDISLTSFKQYAAGKGNPGIATVERVTSKMGLDFSTFANGSFSDPQLDVLKTFFDVFNLFQMLTPEKRNKLANLLIAIISLFADGECGENNA